MPAIQLQTPVALIPLRPDVNGVFFKDSTEPMDRFATTADRAVLDNHVVLLGVEVFMPSDNNLINHVKVHYDDSACDGGFMPEIGKLGDRTISRVGSAKLSENGKYKTSMMVLDNPTPIDPGVMTLILA